MKSYLIPVLFACAQLFCAVGSKAQNGWQWGIRGGGKAGIGTTNYVMDIATDGAGNQYLLTQVATVPGSVIEIADDSLKGFGGTDICVVSFDCSGKLRWRKVIGGMEDDLGKIIRTDSMGGVYIGGYINAADITGAVIDSDTTLAGNNLKQLFILKYDTAGNYKWFRQPEPDTPITAANAWLLDMDVDNGGNISLLAALKPGTYASNLYPVISGGRSAHMLIYNAHGYFIKAIPMQISAGADGASLSGLTMAWDKNNRRYYVCGNAPITFGSTTLTHSFYIGRFTEDGNCMWVRQSSSGTMSLMGRPALDNDGSVYIAGDCEPGANFNGFVFTNSLAAVTATNAPVLIRLDSNGRNKWVLNGASSEKAQCAAVCVSNGIVGVTGVTTVAKSKKTPLSFGSGFELHLYAPFMLRADAVTGDILSLDSLSGSDGQITPISMAADAGGNFYSSGSFTASSLEVPGIDTLVSGGGYTDFYMVKFGKADCARPVSLLPDPEQESFHVYPNPADNYINIETQYISTARLYDLMGQFISSKQLSPPSDQMGVENLSPGTYLLQLTAKNGRRHTTRVFKR